MLNEKFPVFRFSGFSRIPKTFPLSLDLDERFQREAAKAKKRRPSEAASAAAAASAPVTAASAAATATAAANKAKNLHNCFTQPHRQGRRGAGVAGQQGFEGQSCRGEGLWLCNT